MSRQFTPMEEGELAGRRSEGTAADCPYLPGKEAEARSEWLRGFGKTRPTSSPASDPAHADDLEPDHTNEPELPGYKEG